MSYVTLDDVQMIADDVIDDVDDPLAFEACEVENVGALRGTHGYKTLKTELKSGDLNKDVPPGALVREEEINYDEVAYKAQKQTGKGFIPDEAEAQMEQYDRDAVEDTLEEAVQEALFTVDHKLATYLETTGDVGTLNENNGSWDTSSSTPYKDLREAARETVDADTVLMGSQVLEALREHPDTKEFGDVDGQRSGYSGDGQAPVDYTIEKVRQAYRSIENVHVFETPYDTAALGLSESIGRLFDEYCAVYHKARLFCFDPDVGTNPRTRTDDDIDRAAMKVRHDRYVDYQHPITTLGQVADVIG